LVRDWILIKTAKSRATGPKRNSSHSALVKTPERYIGTMTKKLSTARRQPDHHQGIDLAAKYQSKLSPSLRKAMQAVGDDAAVEDQDHDPVQCVIV